MNNQNSLISKIVIFSFLSLFFMGCSIATHYIQTGSRVYPETNPTDIKVFSGEPSVEFVVIGSIAVDTPGNGEKAYEYLKEKAALTGADAVIQVRLSTMKTNVSRIGLNGVLIKYTK